MKYKIKKVAVLGSGVMGSGIACHLANVGLEVLMLDILPKDLKNKKERNLVSDGALEKAIKSKPSPLYKKSFVKYIKTGNFEDDFEKISEADWIIEVVVELLEIKRKIFESVEKYRKPGSLVTSNTSSIPISILAKDRSDDFKKHFCGTHFFNPPRYMRLLEIIPSNDSKLEMIDFFMEFGSNILGKQTVLCKDTTAFIANRIGVMSGCKIFELTEKYDMTIEEVDAITGTLIGRPNTASYRLQDLVGLDTSDKVTKFVVENAEGDAFFKNVGETPTPKFFTFLIENNFLGNKTKKGFYEKTDKKDDNGRTIINALDLKTLKYRPSLRPKLEVVKNAKGIESMSKRIQNLISGKDKVNLFLNEYFASLFSYVIERIPEISEQYYQIDDAMCSGYFWDYGPFEYWDLLGFEKGLEMISSEGLKLPDWIQKMQKINAGSFYLYENGEKKYFNLQTEKYESIPGSESIIILDSFRENKPVIKNSECTVHDIGDGVLCLEFRSKSNSLGDGIIKAIDEAISIAEEGKWKGIVIGNNAKQFSVGANLMGVGMFAMQKKFDDLQKMVSAFQQVMMKIRTSKIPVVAATQGYVFGGGCEIAMHCDAGIYAAESYIGLVEVGVGLLPAGGGTKEFALRASESFFEGDVKIPTLIDYFKTIATATVATSAHQAFDLHYLNPERDFVCYNTPQNIAVAKEKVIELSKNYIAPSVKSDIEVLGRNGLSVLYSAINEFRLGEFMSDYDVEIAKKVAYVICGGDLTGTQHVTEQYLLDLEREAFVSLLGNQKTLDRIQYLLMNNKPLRN
ncbi:MAG: 3-hydroxyacyl-CoA dehydrogenase/enoyl-CoA hydratase family protein [Bacteroidota bacterium]|nr:3-hydroxyacyl-CoA dehydrogenase/enoyl-CoA hydratase family protein [Bacteroidota bacterium]